MFCRADLQTEPVEVVAAAGGTENVRTAGAAGRRQADAARVVPQSLRVHLLPRSVLRTVHAATREGCEIR